MINVEENYDIVIIDSGVNLQHPLLQGEKIYGFSVCIIDGIFRIKEDFQDYYGHGTAMYSIIRKETGAAKILNIKVVDNNDGTLTCNQLVTALEYVYEHINCTVINLSLGVRSSRHKEELNEICNKLYKKGVILVSAFDNEECITFPAAFRWVIGVETGRGIKKAECIEYVEDSIINIRAKGVRQKLPWCKPLYAFLEGNSIACAHVTAIVYKILKDEHLEFDVLLERLEKAAVQKVKPLCSCSENFPSDFYKINNASLFPFNKEMHALIRFRASLSFEIISVHDVKYSGRVGSSCQHLINVDNQEELIIQNIDQIPWQQIDTLILGHCGQLNQILGMDIRQKLVREAISRQVNIYSFDCLEQYRPFSTLKNINIYWPQLTGSDVPYGNFNKLYHIDKPVISIMGTSSRQGKFTLQNMLRKLFVDSSYHVGCISTEPNGYLLGMDQVFPIGYQAVLDITEHEKIQIVNRMIYELCDDNDVILAAGQANSIPFSSYALDTFPVKQNAFLMGLQSDLIILCVNPFDDMNYIHYTIQYLEGISQCKVCGLVLFPMTYYADWRGMQGAKQPMDKDNVEEHCCHLEKIISRPCYSIYSQQSIEKLFTDIIRYLAEES